MLFQGFRGGPIFPVGGGGPNAFLHRNTFNLKCSQGNSKTMASSSERLLDFPVLKEAIQPI